MVPRAARRLSLCDGSREGQGVHDRIFARFFPDPSGDDHDRPPVAPRPEAAAPSSPFTRLAARPRPVAFLGAGLAAGCARRLGTVRSLSSLPLLGRVLVLAADRWLLAAATVGLGGVILLHDPHPDGHAVAVRFVLVFLGLFLTLMTVLTAMDVVVRVLLDTPITPHDPSWWSRSEGSR